MTSSASASTSRSPRFASWQHKKGLYRMDLQYLLMQKRMLGVLALICVCYIIGDLTELLMALLPFLAGLIASNTIIPALYERDSRFMMTLPYSRKEFVREKYGFMIGCSTLVLLLIAGLIVVFNPAQSQGILISAFAILMACLLLTALLIPLMIRFGRSAQIYLRLLLAGLIGGVMMVATADLFPLGDLLAFLETNRTWIVVCGLAAGVILLCLSVRLSDHLIEKMEF